MIGYLLIISDVYYIFYIGTQEFREVEKSLKGFPYDEWFKLGLELGLFCTTLEEIRLKYPGEPAKCFRRMLYQWLMKEDNVQERGGANWKVLEKALRYLNEKEIASKIINKIRKVEEVSIKYAPE